MAENTTLNTRIVLRNDESANWADQVLLKGEAGIEFDANGKAKMKIGTGAAWSETDYFGGEEAKVYQVDSFDELPTENLAKGDTAIVTTQIATGVNSYTGYVWNGEAWAAMDGNYNAENVYFDEDITITTNVGNITVSNGSGSIPAAGKNLKQVFEAMYTKEDLVITVDQPSVSLSLDSTSASGEVGTTFTRPTATFKVSDIGSYEYGSLDKDGVTKDKTATGVTFDSLKLCFGADHTITTEGHYVEATDGGYVSNAQIQLAATSSHIASNVLSDTSTTYKFSALAKHTASPNAPKTNLGNMLKAGSYNSNKTTFTGTATTNSYGEAVGFIPANTNMTPNDVSFTAAGYRCWFIYIGTDNTSAVDNAFIRSDAVTNKGDARNAAGATYTIPGGTKRVMIALPTGTVGSNTYSKKLKACIDVDGMGLDQYAAGKFVETTVQVKGANDYEACNYTVYTLENANGLAATSYTLTIS